VIRATLDTNIYISAFNFGGLPLTLIRLARRKHIHLAVSDAIRGEIKRILSDKFSWPETEISRTLAQLSTFSELVTPDIHIAAVKDDPTDNRILECAVAGRSDYIVTGDKHLLRLVQFREIRIVTPAEFLEIAAQAT
jgi:uncharacterized protein